MSGLDFWDAEDELITTIIIESDGYRTDEGEFKLRIDVDKVIALIDTNTKERARLADRLKEGAGHIEKSQEEKGEGSVRFDTVRLYAGLSMIQEVIAELSASETDEAKADSSDKGTASKQDSEGAES